MNIQTARATYESAKTAAANGQNLQAARLFIGAQRMASQCKAAARSFIFDYAHAGAVLQAAAVIRNSADNAERSEAGQIRDESSLRFQKGL